VGLTQSEKAQQDYYVQRLLGELNFTLTRDGYYKDYRVANGTIVRIVPAFYKELNKRYFLNAISIDDEVISVVADKQIDFSKIPVECMDDVLRILAELAPEAIISKKESFILTMVCTKCHKEVSSYLSIKGVVKCLKCAGCKL
jgi:phosphomannomutase